MDIESYYGIYTGADTTPGEQSTVVYFSIVDKCADTKEAMEDVLSMLYKELHIGVKATHLVLADDQKTYNRLCELKYVCDTDLDWLIPFIGDCHLLSNFQSVLMKVYYDAELKDLAESAGFHVETLTSLAKCSNLTSLFSKHGKHYRHMLSCFLSQSAADYSISSEKVMADVEECDRQCSISASYKPMKERIAMLEDKLGEVHKSFLCYVSAKGESNITWKFWKEFVFRDAFAYLRLFLSIRGGIWDLRTASIKTIAPMFTAFDRPHYRKLIPQHLKDLQTLPAAILHYFRDGAFVCSILGSHMHSISLDEAHEMLINKGIKAAVVRPTK